MCSEAAQACTLLSPELAPPWSIRFCDLFAALDREDHSFVESWLSLDPFVGFLFF
jgi:hypothetical protein